MAADVLLIKLDTSLAAELLPAAEYAVSSGQLTVEQACEILQNFVTISVEPIASSEKHE